MELFFDTETSDRFNFKTDHYYDKDFPWMVQLGAVLAEEGIAYAELNLIIRPNGRTVSDGAAAVHNISIETAQKVGLSEDHVCWLLLELINHADTLVAHNYQFDSQILAAMLFRNGHDDMAAELVKGKKSFCTMQRTTNLCRLPGPYGFKWPKLVELHQFLFNEGFVGAHDAMFDIKATMKCYYELKRKGHIK